MRSRHVPVLVICAFLAAFLPRPALAHDRDDAAKASKAVDRAEAVLEDATALARTAARNLEAATAAMPAAQQKVAESRGAVAAATVAANTAKRKADSARTAYAQIVGEFDAAQGRFEAARAQVDRIAQASYKGSSFSRINVLVDATGPADVMDRLGLVEQIMHSQQADVTELLGARTAARSAQDRAGLAKRTAEEAEAAARDKLNAAKSAEQAAERARAALQSLADSRQAALRLANSQRSAVLARYEAAKAEEERVQAALRGWSAKSGSAEGHYSGGKLYMPVDGWKSSDYGERYDPYYHVWQLHAGTDFAAGGGTPIHAAASGRVVQAGYRGGYGNYTCISHGRVQGRTFTSCYGHQSAMLVHEGEYVRRGQVIGRVGTTGASTGNHLHFETRFDGEPRNPLHYLPRCLC